MFEGHETEDARLFRNPAREERKEEDFRHEAEEGDVGEPDILRLVDDRNDEPSQVAVNNVDEHRETARPDEEPRGRELLPEDAVKKEGNRHDREEAQVEELGIDESERQHGGKPEDDGRGNAAACGKPCAEKDSAAS